MPDYHNLIIDILKDSPYQELGDELRFSCPFCNSDKNKFYISSVTGQYICYNCGVSGSFQKLIHELYHLSYPEAKEVIDQGDSSDLEVIGDSTLYDYLLTLNQEDMPVSDNTRLMKSPPLPSGVKRIVEYQNSLEALPYLNYLNSRGVTWKQIVDNDICYIINGSCYTRDNKILSINNSVLFKTFWQGKQVYWNTRSIEKNPWIKTYNASAHANEYSRNDVVFGLDKLRQGQSLVICEGVFNALTISNDNFQGVATFGKMVTDNQIKLIVSQQNKFKDIRVFLDNDAMDQSIKLIHKLQGMYNPKNIYLVNNPYGNKDANDLGSEEAIKLVSNASKVSLFDELRKLV